MRFIQYLTEIDWEGEFSDTQKTCIPHDVLVDDLNNELKRLNTPDKDRKKMHPHAPIVTKGIIKDVSDDGEIDVEAFIKLITKKPNTIFDQNPKMERTDAGASQMTVNTGLPAIRGIIYDKEDKKFYKINTCPGAGDCQVACYARKSRYVFLDGKVLKLMQRLNYLMNDPEGYYDTIMDELDPIAHSLRRKKRKTGEDAQLVIRWNDAGDFFSKVYFNIAKRVTKDLIDDGYNVKSYAYTKMGHIANIADDDFIMNFSQSAAHKETAKVDLDKTKQSLIVPKEIFKDDVFLKSGSHNVSKESLKKFAQKLKSGGKLMKPQAAALEYTKDMNLSGLPENLPIFLHGGRDKLKRNISKKYGIPVPRLRYTNELPAKEGKPNSFDVIVLPAGDSDIGAQRRDVQRSFLLVH